MRLLPSYRAAGIPFCWRDGGWNIQVPWRKPKRNHVKDCPQKPRCNHKVTFLVKAGSLDRYIDRRKLAGRIKKKKKISKYSLTS